MLLVGRRAGGTAFVGGGSDHILECTLATARVPNVRVILFSRGGLVRPLVVVHVPHRVDQPLLFLDDHDQSISVLHRQISRSAHHLMKLLCSFFR